MLWDTVGYLPTIDFPASAMNTISEVLMKARQTKDELKLKHILVPRLDAFHTTSCLLSVIGKRFSSAGLRDVIKESGVIEEGSVDGILTEKAYNRAVRFHRLM